MKNIDRSKLVKYVETQERFSNKEASLVLQNLITKINSGAFDEEAVGSEWECNKCSKKDEPCVIKVHHRSKASRLHLLQ